MYTVRDDSFPFLMLGAEKQALPWSHGGLYSAAAAGTLLRVSPRGLQVNRMALAHRAGMGHRWHTDTCLPAPHSLCDTTQMRWFPTDIVDVPDDWGRLPDNAFMWLANHTEGCRSTESARDINVFDTHYDVSLCDTLDRALDVVVLKQSGEAPLIAWRSDNTPVYEYVLIAIMGIYLVSCVSQNVIDMFSPINDRSTHVRLADTASLILVLAYGMYCCATGVGSLLMLRGDQVLAVHLLLHVAVAIVREPLYGPSRSHIPGVHISAAISCVMLLAARVHFSFDNPYTQLLSTFFGWRCFVKVIASQQCTPWDVCIVAFDAFVLCSVIGNAVAGTELDHRDAAIKTGMLMAIALAGAIPSASNVLRINA